MMYYSHFLIVLAVAVAFSWNISKLLLVLTLLLNSIFLSTKKSIMFIGLKFILLSIFLQVNIRKNEKAEEKS